MNFAWPITDWGRAWPLLSLGVVPASFLALSQVTPLGPEHVLVATLLLASAWSSLGRKFSLVLAPLTAAGFGYELFPVFARFRGEVMVKPLWDLDHALFPVPGSSDSLSDLLSSFSWAPLDLVSGVIYLTHLPEAMGLAALLFFRGDVPRAQQLAVGFFFLNVIGWCMWLTWPAAPPWYVDQHGLGPANLNIAASAAGGVRFDELVGLPLFEDLYSRSTNVFGAFPSQHAGFATIAAIFGYGSTRSIRWFTLTYALLMYFSAVYLRHHYIVDVVAGIASAFVASGLVTVLWGSAWREPEKTAQPANSAEQPA